MFSHLSPKTISHVISGMHTGKHWFGGKNTVIGAKIPQLKLMVLLLSNYANLKSYISELQFHF